MDQELRVRRLQASVDFLRAELERAEASLLKAKTIVDATFDNYFNGTGGHDGKQKPTIVGVYQRDLNGTEEPHRFTFSFFDGLSWHLGAETPENALLSSTISNYQDQPWCGLTGQA